MYSCKDFPYRHIDEKGEIAEQVCLLLYVSDSLHLGGPVLSGFHAEELLYRGIERCMYVPQSFLEGMIIKN